MTIEYNYLFIMKWQKDTRNIIPKQITEIDRFNFEQKMRCKEWNRNQSFYKITQCISIENLIIYVLTEFLELIVFWNRQFVC